MSMLRSVTVGAVATAMLATSVTPAMAQGYPGGYGYGNPGYNQGYNSNGYRGYRQRNKDNTGAIVAGVIGVGILAAIIASSSKSKNNSNGGYNNYGSIRSDNQAADACASAAERQIGGDARTRSIDTVDQVGGGFNVRGTVTTGFNDRGDTRSFSCSVRYGDIQRVDFGGYAYGY